MQSPYIMNVAGLIYLQYLQKDLNQKSIDMIKELLNNALSYKNQIMQNVHIGCIYKNFGQLYETALKQDIGNYWVLFKEAISNYRTAQKYLDHYNCPYDFAMISFKLSQLYFRYWKFTNDIQALRDAVFFLREAEKTFNQISFPELWSKIEGYLGFYLSLLGLFSKSNEISKLAIKSYKNKQTVYRKELYPVMWAKIQENIANVYYNMGKNARDNTAFASAIDYYKSALKVYENKKMHNEISTVNTSMDKVLRAWKE
jgi:tetratricopeptide (TPR) repeat protein